jgi:hypothetical protein
MTFGDAAARPACPSSCGVSDCRHRIESDRAELAEPYGAEMNFRIGTRGFSSADNGARGASIWS